MKSLADQLAKIDCDNKTERTEVSSASRRGDDDGFSDDVSALGEDEDAFSVFSYTTNSTMTSAFSEHTDGKGNPVNGGKKEYINPKVAAKEGKWVEQAKMLVAGVLLVAMFAMASMTFYSIRQGEYDDFRSQVCTTMLSLIMSLSVTTKPLT